MCWRGLAKVKHKLWKQLHACLCKQLQVQLSFSFHVVSGLYIVSGLYVMASKAERVCLCVGLQDLVGNTKANLQLIYNKLVSRDSFRITSSISSMHQPAVSSSSRAAGLAAGAFPTHDPGVQPMTQQAPEHVLNT